MLRSLDFLVVDSCVLPMNEPVGLIPSMSLTEFLNPNRHAD